MNSRILFAVLLLITLAPSSMLADDPPPLPERESDEPLLRVRAEDLEKTVIVASLDHPMVEGKNLVWCLTFQLAWNRLCDLAGGPIRLTPSSTLSEKLNRREGNGDDLDHSCYVAAAGLSSEGIYEKIREELKAKFGDKARVPLIDDIPPQEWVAFAYLYKQLPFAWNFNRFPRRLSFAGKPVECFGIYQLLSKMDKAEKAMADQVVILDHQTNDDFVIELKTRSKTDRLILAKIMPSQTLTATVDAVEKRIRDVRPSSMGQAEDLFIPVIDFDVLKSYDELNNRAISSNKAPINGSVIAFALQSIRFRLDETGAVLKSSSMIATPYVPRKFIFDNPFLVLLRKKGAKRPYFAMWVANIELLVESPIKLK
jgi:hypothetical protein